MVAEGPRFRSTGLRTCAELLQEREVLHVAGADLEHVGVVGDHRQRLGVHHLGHDLEAGLLAGEGEELQPLLGQPLELVGARARLEGAAAEEARARPPSPRGRPRGSAPATRPSTGPAMTAMLAARRAATPPTSMTVSSSFTSRETSLNGWETRIASATPGMVSNWPGSSPPLLPVMPIATRCAPGMGCGASPSARIFSTTASISRLRGVRLHDDEHRTLPGKAPSLSPAPANAQAAATRASDGEARRGLDAARRRVARARVPASRDALARPAPLRAPAALPMLRAEGARMGGVLRAIRRAARHGGAAGGRARAARRGEPRREADRLPRLPAAGAAPARLVQLAADLRRARAAAAPRRLRRLLARSRRLARLVPRTRHRRPRRPRPREGRADLRALPRASGRSPSSATRRAASSPPTT